MGQDYTIDWVGQSAREWSSQHGKFLDFTVALAGEEGTVKLTQKPETSRPEVGQHLFGRIEEQTFTDGEGKPFQVRKFKKEKREDGAAPRSMPTTTVGGARPDSPGPEFWAAKDRRLARAGMTQAVVQATKVDHDLISGKADLGTYVAAVARLTDALLEDLESRTPSPNQTSPATLESSSGGSADGVPTGTDDSPSAGAGGANPDPPLAPPPDLADLKLALAACGHDNADPEQAFAALNPDQKAQVKTIVENLKSKYETTIPATGGVSDDEDIPF